MTPTVHMDTYPEIDPAKVDLSGKAVLVTGGSRGLGRAIVLSYAKAGASFIAAAARQVSAELAADVEAAAKSANRPPPKYLPLTLDVSDPESVKEAAAKLEKEFGRCDIIVNNAGVFGNFQTIEDYDLEIWSKVFDVNLRGPFLMAKALLPLMVKTGGAYIVNVSSAGAILTTGSISPYQISKTAVSRLSEFITKEYSEKGIVSFSVHPGNVVTDMTHEIGVLENPEYSHCAFPTYCFDEIHCVKMDTNSFIVFVDTPELCGDTLVFLTSEKRAWIGGRFINVTWNMPELMAQKDEIVKEDKLKITLKI